MSDEHTRAIRQCWIPVLLLFGAWQIALAADDEPFAGRIELVSSEFIDAVLERNPSLPAMEAAWEAARARIKQATSLDDPMLSYAYAPDTRDVPGLAFGQRYQISQSLPWPGKRRLRGEVAKEQADAAGAQVTSRRRDLIATAKGAYADWYYVHQALQVNAVNRDLWRQFKAIAETRYATGTATQQDALQAEVESYRLEHQSVVLERRRLEVLAMLNSLLNRPPSASLPPPAQLGGTQPLPDIDQLRTAALSTSPQLRALAAQVEGHKAKVAQARLNFLPDFAVTAAHNSLWDRDEKQNMVGINLNLPLYAGKRRAALAQAKAELRQAELSLRDASAQIEAKTVSAYERLRESVHVIELYRERILPATEDTLNAARSDYQAGRGDFLNLVSAEKNLIQARLEYHEALADTYRRNAELERLAGGIETYTTASLASRSTQP